MKRVVIALSIVVLLLAFTMVSCTESSSRQRGESIQTRAQMFARAQALYPIPQTVNFPARQSLVKYTERQDMKNHPYYVYVLADTGNIIGYYVSQSQPVNINAFLSSTEDVLGSGTVVTAPSLDGIYYGGAGASAESNGWFFFDAQTDALIILYGVKLFVADQPLKLEAKPITVSAK